MESWDDVGWWLSGPWGWCGCIVCIMWRFVFGKRLATKIMQHTQFGMFFLFFNL